MADSTRGEVLGRSFVQIDVPTDSVMAGECTVESTRAIALLCRPFITGHGLGSVLLDSNSMLIFMAEKPAIAPGNIAPLTEINGDSRQKPRFVCAAASPAAADTR
jgi:hypothetical protein